MSDEAFEAAADPEIADVFNLPGANDTTAAKRQAFRRHSAKVQEVCYGVVRAAAEAGGWILGGEESNMSGKWQGSIFKYACDEFASRTGGLAKPPVVFGTCNHNMMACNQANAETLRNWTGDAEDFKETWVNTFRSFAEDPSEGKYFKYAFPAEVDLWESGVALTEKVSKRVMWPNQREACSVMMKGVASRSNYARAMEGCVNPRLSHIIFYHKSPAVAKLRSMLTNLAPSAVLAVDAADSDKASILTNMAAKGMHVVLLKHAGRISTALAEGIESMKGGSNHATTCSDIVMPTKTTMRNFHTIDCVRDSADQVIFRLTRALSGGWSEEHFELCFADSEQRRLLRAWELHIQYSNAAAYQRQLADKLFCLILLMTILTQFSVMLYSQLKQVEEHGKASELSSFSTGFTHHHKVACGIFPVISALLISINNKFSPHAKAAYLEAAASKVRGEIYRYRTRVGIYAVRSSSARIARILAQSDGSAPAGPDAADQAENCSRVGSPSENGSRMGRRRAAVAASAIRQASSDVDDEEGSGEDSGQEGGAPARAQTIFSECIETINNDLMNSEVRMESMATPSHAAVRRFIEKLSVQQQAAAPLSWTARITQRCSWCCSRQGQGSNDDIDVEMALDGKPLDHKECGVPEDDGFSLLSGSDYVLFRVMPKIRYYSAQSQNLVAEYKALYLLILMTTGASTFLSLLEMEHWIPVVVSIAAGLSAYLDFANVQARIANSNKALLALKNRLIWWEGQSMVRRRFPQSKELLVEAAEAAVEAERGVLLSFRLSKSKTAGTNSASTDEGGGGTGSMASRNKEKRSV